MTRGERLEELLAQYIGRRMQGGGEVLIEELCPDEPELAAPLRALIDSYLALDAALDMPPTGVPEVGPPGDAAPPRIDGFQVIERIGSGGMGEVYKLRDLTLNRVVAAKVMRHDRAAAVSLAEFLREARSLALFADPRIMQIFDCRPEAEPPVIIAEFVDGFALDRIGPSLEFRQRAQILREVCEAIHHAHRLGIQHRDLKPANILVGPDLHPKILDFGLAAGDSAHGHFRGTPAYMAPEQLDPSLPIDARTDVYSLGVILYQLLSGSPPFVSERDEELISSIRTGRPRLPAEVEPAVPEPLQAVALKAMEKDPQARYLTARDMALDLQRYLDGRPVMARPSDYSTALSSRLRAHLQQIDEWLRLRFIYPHEAERLKGAYRSLEARDEDWIVASRTLSYSQIALYLGAFLLVCGSLFYFGAHRFYDAVKGVLRPFAVLGLPFLGLNAAARLLERREHRAVAVAFYLGGIGLLPLFLIIALHESGIWVAAPETAGQFFTDGSISNRQLQVTILAAALWTAFLALRTRTLALSTAFSAVLPLCALALLTDAGLRSWIDEERYDLLALHLLPLVLVYGGFGHGSERTTRPWLARSLFLGGAVTLMICLELLALDGRMLHYLGLSAQAFQPAGVQDPLLLDTVAGMTLDGLIFYAVAAAIDRRGTELMRLAAGLLFAISPFAVLQPLGWLSRSGEYSRRYDWLYLALALTIAFLSRRRQRKSFYYAGMLNTGAALWLIADHYEWFDKPLWAVAVVAAGLLLLAAGFGLAAREKERRT